MEETVLLPNWLQVFYQMWSKSDGTVFWDLVLLFYLFLMLILEKYKLFFLKEAKFRVKLSTQDIFVKFSQLRFVLKEICHHVWYVVDLYFSTCCAVQFYHIINYDIAIKVVVTRVMLCPHDVNMLFWQRKLTFFPV